MGGGDRMGGRQSGERQNGGGTEWGRDGVEVRQSGGGW